MILNTLWSKVFIFRYFRDVMTFILFVYSTYMGVMCLVCVCVCVFVHWIVFPAQKVLGFVPCFLVLCKYCLQQCGRDESKRCSSQVENMEFFYRIRVFPFVCESETRERQRKIPHM
jgi:nucleoside recognition membrane protein YjiH